MNILFTKNLGENTIVYKNSVKLRELQNTTMCENIVKYKECQNATVSENTEK